jgi:Transglutaminase elicitor
MYKMIVTAASPLICFAFALNAHANIYNPKFLNEFRKNPRQAMNALPEKRGSAQDTKFLEDKIDACRKSDTRDFIIKRANAFQKSSTLDHRTSILNLLSLSNLHQPNLSLPVAETEDQSARDFLEVSDIIDNINTLDENFKTGEVTIKPWSDDYWAIRTGITGKRYLDPNFPGLTTEKPWLDSYNYYLQNPPKDVDAKLYSPSEKYDSLVADTKWTLTDAGWAEGKRFNDEHGDVEKWMGICHGWAPASFMEPRPTHSVQAQKYTPEGLSTETIEFLPDDIKALATLKWANGINATADLKYSGTRFMGWRCNTKDPITDSETGRVTDPGCFDINPGTWHIIVTNQIAREARPFVIDAAFDYEVWNHPVTKYEYTYFNPKSLDYVKTLDAARTQLDDSEFKDKFKKYRNNPKAVEVVGVVMTVWYVVETSPHGSPTNSPSQDRTRSAQYHYDLELDKQGKIIGGEWYQNRHPDFVWMPIKNSVVVNQEDLYINSEKDIVRVAPDASIQMAPLRYVLDSLLSEFK